MFRRALGILLALALVTATGCGSRSSAGSLDDALRYTPRDSALVMVFDTDPEGQQWQQVDKLLSKFPFAGTLKQQLKTRLNSSEDLDYDRDIKPQLGNPLVLTIPSIAAPNPPVVITWKPKDEDKLRKLFERSGYQKTAPIEGADTYRTQAGEEFVLKDGTLVVATSTEALTAALGSHGDHLTAQQLDDNLGDLAGEALLKMTGDARALYGDPSGVAAQKLNFVRAQKSVGIVMRAEPDGIEFAFVNESDSVPEAELPLAPGEQPAPVIRRGGEIGIGLRDPARTITFYEHAFKAAFTPIANVIAKAKAKLNRQLGIDIDRDVVSQLHGNAYASVALDGGFALRVDLRDPAAATATLKRVAPRLTKVAHGGTVTRPKGGAGLYSVGRPGGKRYAFGVVGKSFVFATDAARAAQFAGESPTTVPGTKGALVVAADARAVANKIAAQQGQGAAAQVVTGPLGDLIGWVEWEREHSAGSVKLFIK
jgi:hypothetical protein